NQPGNYLYPDDPARRKPPREPTGGDSDSLKVEGVTPRPGAAPGRAPPVRYTGHPIASAEFLKERSATDENPIREDEIQAPACAPRKEDTNDPSRSKAVTGGG
ncbi:MAG: hypothetical protein Q9188_006891, partial [Gyalolechia gomerana]